MINYSSVPIKRALLRARTVSSSSEVSAVINFAIAVSGLSLDELPVATPAPARPVPICVIDLACFRHPMLLDVPDAPKVITNSNPERLGRLGDSLDAVLDPVVAAKVDLFKYVLLAGLQPLFHQTLLSGVQFGVRLLPWDLEWLRKRRILTRCAPNQHGIEYWCNPYYDRFSVRNIADRDPEITELFREAVATALTKLRYQAALSDREFWRIRQQPAGHESCADAYSVLSGQPLTRVASHKSSVFVNGIIGSTKRIAATAKDASPVSRLDFQVLLNVYQGAYRCYVLRKFFVNQRGKNPWKPAT